MDTNSPVNPLQNQIHAAIQRNPHLGGRDLRFEANAGRITLSGRVGSYFQKQMAQEAVRQVDGVVEIQNDLEVNWSPTS